MKNNLMTLFLALTLFLTGCLPPDGLTTSFTEDSNYHPIGRKSSRIPYAGNPEIFLASTDAQFLTQDQKDCIRDFTVFNKFCLGMPNAGVVAALGLPDKKEEIASQHGAREMWVYRYNSMSPIYLFLENHRLASWGE